MVVPTMLGLPNVPQLSPLAARAERERPPADELVDTFGRIARDLRISLTEKCSLRCTYCMPEEGLSDIQRESLLSADEVIRIASIAVHHLGIREIRFTGGEPLMRSDLEEIVAGCTAAAPDIPLSLTTNGIGLSRRAAALTDAGLTRINVSLDTVDRVRYTEVTRRDRLYDAQSGIRAAVRAGLMPVKVNAVVLSDLIDGAADLLRWCIDEGVDLRFIESMPLDADQNWSESTIVVRDELLERLGQCFGLRPIGRTERSDPADLFLVDGGPATVGIISTISTPFCADCDRTRLTAEGSVRACLFDDHEISLRDELRGGATDAELAQRWRQAMWAKPAGHSIGQADFRRPQSSMGAIGG